MARQGDSDYNNYNLVLSDANDEDTGVYEVSASNSHGESKSYSKLSVQKSVTSSSSTTNGETFSESSSQTTVSNNNRPISGQPPEFKKLLNDVQASLGDNIRLDAIILGSPKPRVSVFFFYFNDIAVQRSNLVFLIF
jgi:hypothetical protein